MVALGEELRALATEAPMPAGDPVHLIWVRSDAETLRHPLAARGSGRDAAKPAGFDAFTASMRLEAEPAAPHMAVDNRLTTPARLEAQVAALVKAVQTPADELPDVSCL